MALLTKEQILQADDLSHEDVFVPEWGGVVRLRALTGAERDQFEAETIELRGQQTRPHLANVRARLVALSAVDETGRRLFSSVREVEALGQKSAAALDRLFDVAARLSGLMSSAVEDFEKNFALGQSEESGSD